MRSMFLLSAVLLFVTHSHAAVISDPKCKDLEQVKAGFTPQYLAVIDGFNKNGKEVADEVDVAGIVTESNKVTTACAKNKSAKVKQVRMDLKSAEAKNSSTIAAVPTSPNKKLLNLNKAKCSEFIALGEELQPVAAYWVAGNTKKGHKHSGEIDEMLLERPVATLVEECTSNPTASFYEKAKTWFKNESKAVKQL